MLGGSGRFTHKSFISLSLTQKKTPASKKKSTEAILFLIFLFPQERGKKLIQNIERRS
jgi:hypothetical protein